MCGVPFAERHAIAAGLADELDGQAGDLEIRMAALGEDVPFTPDGIVTVRDLRARYGERGSWLRLKVAA